MSKLQKRFRASQDCQFSTFPTNIVQALTEEKATKELKKTWKELAELQDIMYAHSKYSVLICLQGIDTAGQDSLIRQICQKFKARGVVVHSFVTPTSKQRQQDYIWRHYIALPERGKCGVFDRTH